MILKLLSHAGEHHETISEAVKHSTQTEPLATSSLVYWLVLVGMPILLLFTLKLFKAKIPVILLLISTFLIIYSVWSYQQPGIYSAVALSVGFCIVLVQTIIGLTNKG